MGIIQRLREYAEKGRELNQAYVRAYERCFEDPNQVELKLEVWDSVHRVTRR